MTHWTCGCRMAGALVWYCAQHAGWMCHGGPTDHTQPIHQPNLGMCPTCYFAGMRAASRNVRP